MPDPPKVALLPWGHVIEDFLEPQGLTLEQFANDFTGSWMFGWVDALARARVEVLLVCVSAELRERRLVHRPTGVPIVVLPTTRAYRRAARAMVNPYGHTVEDTFGRSARCLRRLPLAAVRELVPYRATPFMRLGRVLRRERVDALVCQEYEFPRFDACTALGRVLGTPVLATFQGGDHQRWLLERLVRPLSLRSAARLLVAPQGEVDRLRARYGIAPEQIARVVNPVDVDVWRPRDRADARRALDLPEHAHVVAWHGRVTVVQKGLDVLLDAWREVAAADDWAHLLLIGDGADAARLDRMADGVPRVRRIRSHVHDQATLSGYLAAADVYVFPSRHEGFPVAPLEAMASGLPVVAADASGVRELLGDACLAIRDRDADFAIRDRDACLAIRDRDADLAIRGPHAGVVVPREDPPALAAAILRLLADPALRQRLGAAGRRRAEEQFSLDAVGGQLREILVTSSGRRQPLRRRRSARTRSSANAAVEPRAG